LHLLSSGLRMMAHEDERVIATRQRTDCDAQRIQSSREECDDPLAIAS